MKENLKWVEALLQDWADREAKIMSWSVIGYPSRAIGERTAAIPKSRCPEVMMSPRISACHRAVRQLRPDLREVIRCKYEISGTEALKADIYQHLMGVCRRTYYNRLDKAHRLIAARVLKG